MLGCASSTGSAHIQTPAGVRGLRLSSNQTYTFVGCTCMHSYECACGTCRTHIQGVPLLVCDPWWLHKCRSAQSTSSFVTLTPHLLSSQILNLLYSINPKTLNLNCCLHMLLCIRRLHVSCCDVHHLSSCQSTFNKDASLSFWDPQLCETPAPVCIQQHVHSVSPVPTATK